MRNEQRRFSARTDETIEEGFDRYRQAVYGVGALPSTQEKECRQAFFCGIAWFISLAEQLDENNPAHEAHMHTIEAEIHNFGSGLRTPGDTPVPPAPAEPGTGEVSVNFARDPRTQRLGEIVLGYAVETAMPNGEVLTALTLIMLLVASSSTPGNMAQACDNIIATVNGAISAVKLETLRKGAHH